jgi:hypothetical protein
VLGALTDADQASLERLPYGHRPRYLHTNAKRSDTSQSRSIFYERFVILASIALFTALFDLTVALLGVDAAEPQLCAQRPPRGARQWFLMPSPG